LFQPARANAVIEHRLRTGFDSDVVFLGGGFAEKKVVGFLREGAPGMRRRKIMFFTAAGGAICFLPQW
jgi:hypothetical protein